MWPFKKRKPEQVNNMLELTEDQRMQNEVIKTVLNSVPIGSWGHEAGLYISDYMGFPVIIDTEYIYRYGIRSIMIGDEYFRETHGTEIIDFLGRISEYQMIGSNKKRKEIFKTILGDVAV